MYILVIFKFQQFFHILIYGLYLISLQKAKYTNDQGKKLIGLEVDIIRENKKKATADNVFMGTIQKSYLKLGGIDYSGYQRQSQMIMQMIS